MYNLLIVDDEKHIVEWLELLFFTHEEVDVFTASSGDEALNKLQHTKIDIILSDIHMPKMGGLDLLKHVQNKWPNCRVIFLTAYSEFDYIYEATSHSGVSYLLKIEDDEVIIDEVNRAISELKLIQAQRVQQMKQDSLLRLLRYRPTLLHITQGSVDIHKDNSEFDRLPIKICQPIMMVLGKIQSVDLHDQYDTYATIEVLMYERLMDLFNFTQLDYEQNQLLWFIQSVNPHQIEDLFNIRKTLEHITNICNEQLSIQISFLYDNQWVQYTQIPERFNRISYSMNYMIGLENDLVIQIHEDNLLLPDQQSYISHGSLIKLGNMLESHQVDEYLSFLKKNTDELRKRSLYDMSAVEVYSKIALLLLSYINRCRIQQEIMFSIGLGQLLRLSDFEDWDDAIDYLLRLSTVIFNFQESETIKKHNYVVTQITDYVENNIDQDLSLNAISEALHYNPSYLSRLFKTINGNNLSYYILEIRLVKAEHLLKNSRNKVSDIARCIGFESPQYFARVFRKKYGMSPTDYREKLL